MSSYYSHPKDLILEWSEMHENKKDSETPSDLFGPPSFKSVPVFCDWRIRRYQSLTEALAGDFIPPVEDLISTGEDLQKSR